jgi:hypothetical protein
VFELRGLPPSEYRRFNFDSLSEAAGWARGQAAMSYCQMLWMTACSGGFGLLHPIDKPHPGDHLR